MNRMPQHTPSQPQPAHAPRRGWMLALAGAGLAVLLSACASKVNLNEVPVEDARSTPVTAQPAQPAAPVAQPAAPDVNARTVSNVKVDESAQGQAGPAGAARVILFDYDSYVVKPEFQPVIEAHARYLNADRKRRISVEGHTDERGGREYNLALGQKRSEAVRRALGLLGVTDAQVEAVSFGKEKLADPSGTEAAWARNRRAEIVYK